MNEEKLEIKDATIADIRELFENAEELAYNIPKDIKDPSSRIWMEIRPYQIFLTEPSSSCQTFSADTNPESAIRQAFFKAFPQQSHRKQVENLFQKVMKMNEAFRNQNNNQRNVARDVGHVNNAVSHSATHNEAMAAIAQQQSQKQILQDLQQMVKFPQLICGGLLPW